MIDRTTPRGKRRRRRAPLLVSSARLGTCRDAMVLPASNDFRYQEIGQFRYRVETTRKTDVTATSGASDVGSGVGGDRCWGDSCGGGRCACRSSCVGEHLRRAGGVAARHGSGVLGAAGSGGGQGGRGGQRVRGGRLVADAHGWCVADPWSWRGASGVRGHGVCVVGCVGGGGCLAVLSAETRSGVTSRWRPATSGRELAVPSVVVVLLAVPAMSSAATDVAEHGADGAAGHALVSVEDARTTAPG